MERYNIQHTCVFIHLVHIPNISRTAITEPCTCTGEQGLYFFIGRMGTFLCSVLGLSDGGGVSVLKDDDEDMEFPVPIAASVLMLGEGTSPLGIGALKSTNDGLVNVAK